MLKILLFYRVFKLKMRLNIKYIFIIFLSILNVIIFFLNFCYYRSNNLGRYSKIDYAKG